MHQVLEAGRLYTFEIESYPNPYNIASMHQVLEVRGQCIVWIGLYLDTCNQDTIESVHKMIISFKGLVSDLVTTKGLKYATKLAYT